MVPVSDYVSLKSELDRLLSKIEELESHLRIARNQISQSEQENTILIWTNGLNRFVKVKNIAMIEAESNYSLIHLVSGERIFTARTIKYWKEKINSPLLIRVHKSYLINHRNVLSLEKKTKTIVLAGGANAKYNRISSSLINNLI